ncbi:MAG: hypothetical protein AAF203_05490, partial [Pseudomonadota bacterium]
VLSGGEFAALSMIDATVRQIPGVLGHVASALEDSFHNNLLEAPFFTRPRVWEGMEVPSLLLSGDHKKISQFRDQLSLLVTLLKRPDLLTEKDIDFPGLQAFVERFSENDWKSLGFSKEDVNQALTKD